MPKLDIITCALNRATSCMTEHDNKLGPGIATCKFHTSEDVVIEKIPVNSDREYIAQSLIEYQFEDMWESMQLRIAAKGNCPANVPLTCSSKFRCALILLTKRSLPILRISRASSGVSFCCVSLVWVLMRVYLSSISTVRRNIVCSFYRVLLMKLPQNCQHTMNARA